MLTVYRASAGSGKTHLLTGTYIKLLFTEATTFRNILAVTFTNKATEEMKHRIITQLHLLATDIHDSDYKNDLNKQFNLNDEQIKEKARFILIDILHNYSGFNVSTIDTFFQQTTRAFSRELGMQGGFNVELDKDKVINEAIDNLINDLDKPENSQLLEWLISFAQDNIENAKNWNIRKDLFSLALEINKEDYKKYSNEIRNFSVDKENFKKYIDNLKEIKSEFENCVKEIGQNACNIMSEVGLVPSDFKNGKNSPFNLFKKWSDGDLKPPTDTFKRLAGEIENWTAKKVSAQLMASVSDAYYNGLNDMVEQAIEIFETSTIYNSATATLRYLYTLGILSDIDIKMRQYCRDNNIMLISDTAELLNRIIDGKDNPFIYEKTGHFLKNFMIDEFQDTSGMQWENFRPLIDDSVSQMNDNLLVGDVKQSIYRWRNSDWNLLHSKIKEFNTDLREDKILGVNWRSCRAIVEFNNSFFSVAAGLLQNKFNSETSINDDTILMAYSDIAQEVSPPKLSQEGHVRVEFLEAENKAEYEEQVLDILPSVIETMQAKGTALKDIAILVRNSREGALIAKYLLKYKEENPDSPYKYDIISNDSLFIGQSKIIEAVISFMRFLLNDKEPINSFIAEYNIDIASGEKEPETALNDYFNKRDIEKDKNSLLYQKIPELRKLSLFELTEEIINIIIPSDVSLDNLFLQAFQDLVIDFCNSNSADLSSFLKWWDETGKNKTISSPEEQDAIKIITIHKSKGLGFDSVIIPFTSWKIDHDQFKQNLIWCRPMIEPFNMLPVVPIRYGKTMQDSIYKEDYFREKMSAFIDNLNVAYVAFTRAKNEMVIMAPKPKKPESLTDISSVLYSACEWAECDYKTPENILYNPTFVKLTEIFDTNASLLEIGDWYECVKRDIVKTDIKSDSYFSQNPASRIRLRLHGKGKFNEGKEREYGTFMHDILSKIRYPEEIDDAVDNACRSGIINVKESIKIKAKLHDLISNDKVADWFKKDIKVFNEKEILLPNGTVLRPDRIIMDKEKVIVIDYKFGNKTPKSHVRQVSGYIQQLWQMGYKNIEGYLWYTTINKVIKVDMEAPSLF